MTDRRPWTQHPRVIAARQRSPIIDTVVGALDGFRLHQTGRSAALVSHFGFISVFPLFLVFTTVLGFVLQNDQDLQDEIVDSALSKLPLIGSTLAASPDALQGSVPVLVFGLLLALWSGLKAFLALEGALDNINEVDIDDRNSFVTSRVRALAGIGIVGIAQAASAFLTSVVTAAGLPAVSNVLLVAAAALVNAAVLACTYRFLTSATTTWRQVWPGAVFAGIAFSLLQVVGTSVIARSQQNAENVYGDFAAVIALLAWLSLHATVALLGAEINRARVTSSYHRVEP
jgi:membrane protein